MKVRHITLLIFFTAQYETYCAEIHEKYRLLAYTLMSVNSRLDNICSQSIKPHVLARRTEVLRKGYLICNNGNIPEDWQGDMWCINQYIPEAEVSAPREFEHPDGLMFVAHSNRLGYIPIPKVASSTGRQWIQKVRYAEEVEWKFKQNQLLGGIGGRSNSGRRRRMQRQLKRGAARKSKKNSGINISNHSMLCSGKSADINDAAPKILEDLPPLTSSAALDDNIWGLTVRDYMPMSAWNEMFVFAVVRDPLERFWSGWQEVIRYSQSDRGFGRFVTGTTLGTLDIAGTHHTDGSIAAALEAMACGNDFNPHLSTQYSFMKGFLSNSSGSGAYHLDMVVPLERLDFYAAVLAENIGHPHEIEFWHELHNAAESVLPPENREIPESIKDLWCLIYLPDYMLLNHLYRAPQWCAEIYYDVLKYEPDLVKGLLKMPQP